MQFTKVALYCFTFRPKNVGKTFCHHSWRWGCRDFCRREINEQRISGPTTCFWSSLIKEYYSVDFIREASTCLSILNLRMISDCPNLWGFCLFTGHFILGACVVVQTNSYGTWWTARIAIARKICSTRFYYCSTPFEQ